MDALDVLIRSSVNSSKASSHKKSKNDEDKKDGKPRAGVRITSQSNYGFGEAAEIPLANLQDHLRTNLKYRMVVFTNMAHTVGQGFYHTADMSQLSGRKALEIANFFADEWDLDTMNQKIALNVWAAGNTFLNKVSNDPEGNPDGLHGVYKLPLSAFTNIKRDVDGTPLQYIYTWGQARNEPIDAFKILHWAWLPIDEEAFGEGVGQAMARDGLGYESEAGNTIKRKPWFESQERLQDSADKHVIAGLPRYAAFLDPEKGGDDDMVDDLTSGLNKLDPLQHIVVNAIGDIKPIALETGQKFDSFIRMQNDEVVTGFMSPLIRMWSSLDFTYASAESALEAMFPMFDMYQRAHKTFIEKQIYHKILEQENIDWHKSDLRLNWGKQANLTMDDLQQLVALLSNPMFENKFSPEELVDTISETSGVSIEKVADEQKKVINAYRQLDKDAMNGKSITIKYNPAKLSKLDLLQIQKLTKSRN